MASLARGETIPGCRNLAIARKTTIAILFPALAILVGQTVPAIVSCAIGIILIVFHDRIKHHEIATYGSAIVISGLIIEGLGWVTILLTFYGMFSGSLIVSQALETKGRISRSLLELWKGTWPIIAIILLTSIVRYLW